jgi:hypothetical protein
MLTASPTDFYFCSVKEDEKSKPRLLLVSRYEKPYAHIVGVVSAVSSGMLN